MDTCTNEAIPRWVKRRLITFFYLQLVVALTITSFSKIPGCLGETFRSANVRSPLDPVVFVLLLKSFENFGTLKVSYLGWQVAKYRTHVPSVCRSLLRKPHVRMKVHGLSITLVDQESG